MSRIRKRKIQIISTKESVEKTFHTDPTIPDFIIKTTWKGDFRRFV